MRYGGEDANWASIFSLALSLWISKWKNNTFSESLDRTFALQFSGCPWVNITLQSLSAEISSIIWLYPTSAKEATEKYYNISRHIYVFVLISFLTRVVESIYFFVVHICLKFMNNPSNLISCMTVLVYWILQIIFYLCDDITEGLLCLLCLPLSELYLLTLR